MSRGTLFRISHRVFCGLNQQAQNIELGDFGINLNL